MSNETTITTVKYVRKPFEVEAIQVTVDNIEAVSKWCNGKNLIDETDPRRGYRPYIWVDVKRAMNERQRMAYIGDWVLSDGKGFKVFTNMAFQNNFVMKKEPAKDPTE